MITLNIDELGVVFNCVNSLSDLLDGLDSSSDHEVCGISQEDWDERVKQARRSLRDWEKLIGIE